MDAFADVTDEQEADGVALSANVVEDLVEYFRGNAVGHEEESILMTLSMLTGWVDDDGCHNNVIGEGPPGSGKSLTKNNVEDLLPDRDTYTKTDASSNAILDSVEWDLSLVAPLDEYDKVNRNIVEVLKSSNPEDGGYSKDRNVEDPDARGGYSPTEVSADANPWVLLYAPSSKKGGINEELADRALTLYFSNDKHTRRAIGRKEFGHDGIDTGEYDEEYIYDTHALAAAIRQHIRELPVQTHYEDDDGEEYLASRTGASHVYTPPWVWYATEPIFNIDEDYTNRVYGLVVNLMRSSALLNRHERARKEIDVYVDEDSSETETCEAVVVGPQDVANVLSCLPTLLSTTHQLDPLKRHILDAVDATEPMTDGDGTTVQSVRQYLDDNDIPHPSESTLRDRLKELAENYYLRRWESAGGKRGNADLYERRDEGALQPPNVYDLQRYADADDVVLASDDCVDIDPEDPFADCTDPIRDQPFTQTVSDFEAQFSGETVAEMDTDAASFMGGDGDDGDDGSDDADDGGQASLGAVGADGVEDATADDGSSVALDPEGEPANPTEQWVYEHLCAGDVFGSGHNVSHFVGVVDTDDQPTDTGVDTEGTVLDPDHDCWNRPDLADDRVITEADCLRELDDAYESLRRKDIVAEDESGGPPAMFVLRVAKDS